MKKTIFWLTQVDGLGPKGIRDILETCRSESACCTPSGLWNASYEKLVRDYGLSEKLSRAMINKRDKGAIEDQINIYESKGISVIDIDSACYPKLLKEIYDAPVLLYAVGDLELLKALEDRYKGKAVGVVGTRKPTPYGREMTGRIIEDLALQDIVIVSGLALGIDSIAHEHTIKVCGKTIAVLGSGCDVIYPARNRKLYNDIIDSGGLIISEYEPGAQPLRHHFPRRNRIISGLSDAVLVMEASVKSGSLITAHAAIDQGRCVLALPGNVTNPMTRGTLKLIKEGAVPIATASDVLEELGLSLGQASDQAGSSKSDLEKALVRIEPATADQISALLGKEVYDIMLQLTILEMSGKVKRLPGGLFVCT